MHGGRIWSDRGVRWWLAGEVQVLLPACCHSCPVLQRAVARRLAASPRVDDARAPSPALYKVPRRSKAAHRAPPRPATTRSVCPLVHSPRPTCQAPLDARARATRAELLKADQQRHISSPLTWQIRVFVSGLNVHMPLQRTAVALRRQQAAGLTLHSVKRPRPSQARRAGRDHRPGRLMGRQGEGGAYWQIAAGPAAARPD